MGADPLAIAAWELAAGELRSEDLPELASDALGRGWDSPTLGELAAQTPSDVRASRELFGRALVELGIELPDRDHALWNLVMETARAVVEGEVGPEVGARRIWRCYHDVADSGDLRIFVGLASELEDHPEDRVVLERQIVAEATELLSRPHPRIWIKLIAVNGGTGLTRSVGSGSVESGSVGSGSVGSGSVGSGSVGSGSVGVDPAELAVSAKLRSDLAAWNAQHARVIAGWPRSGGFESEADAERFVDAGHRLVSRLQRELGASY